jgi:hypothetical protein
MNAYEQIRTKSADLSRTSRKAQWNIFFPSKRAPNTQPAKLIAQAQSYIKGKMFLVNPAPRLCACLPTTMTRIDQNQTGPPSPLRVVLGPEERS